MLRRLPRRLLARSQCEDLVAAGAELKLPDVACVSAASFCDAQIEQLAKSGVVQSPSR